MNTMITKPARFDRWRLGKARSAVRHAPFLVLLGFVAASIGTFLLRRVVGTPTAGAWLYLPLTLFVTLRWGLARGLLTGGASGLVALAIMVSSLGLPPATDPRLYARLVVAVLGTLLTLTIAARLNRRLMADQRGRAEAETLAGDRPQRLCES